MREGAAEDADGMERFRREARAASALNSPHICTVHDVGLYEGQPFMVMELLEGFTLAERLKARPLPLAELLDLGLQLVEALAAAHGKGIVHRDLKPGNVFLTREGLLKVMDFGVAKLQREPPGQTTSVTGLRVALLVQSGDATSSDSVVGTLPYMSPEQLQGDRVDSRSDLFSLGAVLYEMATGRRAFAGESAEDVVDAILHSNPTPPIRLVPDLPPELDRAILKALEKPRDLRYRTAGEVRDSLVSVRETTLPRLRSRGPRARLFDRPIFARSLRNAMTQLWRPGPQPSTSIDSVAVMPMHSLSGDAAEDLLADGITDALITQLSQIRAVRVISRTSILRYKDTMKAAPEIARELRVDGLVEGSVLLSGNRVRVSARLVQAARDHTSWSRTYERELSDVLTLQSDLAEAVAREIRVALTPEEGRRLIHARRPIDPAAHFSYLRGRALCAKGGPAELQQAVEELQQAVRRDPTLAAAWLSLAYAYEWLGGNTYGTLPGKDALPRARAAAERALELEPSAEGHSTLGFVAERYDLNLGLAREEYERALELNPGCSLAHENYAEHLTIEGRFEDAIDEAKLAIELDPFSVNTRANLTWRYYLARRYEEAYRHAQQSLLLDASFAATRLQLGFSLLAMNRCEEALTELRRFHDLAPGSLSLASLAYGQARGGLVDEAQAKLAELMNIRERQYVCPDRIALVYLGLGDKQRSLDWLEQLAEDRAPGRVELPINPIADSLRSEPRFQALIRSMGLTPHSGGAT
jgi:serine/threonine protein kinase/tetratricopeptide (TPR) repeat protein